MNDEEYMTMPEPGLDGTYTDACLMCLGGTDSGFVVAGQSEDVILALVALGMEMNEACLVVELATTGIPGYVPDGELTIPIRCCSECAAGSPFQPGLIPHNTMVYRLEDDDNA